MTQVISPSEYLAPPRVAPQLDFSPLVGMMMHLAQQKRQEEDEQFQRQMLARQLAEHEAERVLPGEHPIVPETFDVPTEQSTGNITAGSPLPKVGQLRAPFGQEGTLTPLAEQGPAAPLITTPAPIAPAPPMTMGTMPVQYPVPVAPPTVKLPAVQMPSYRGKPGAVALPEETVAREYAGDVARRQIAMKQAEQMVPSPIDIDAGDVHLKAGDLVPPTTLTELLKEQLKTDVQEQVGPHGELYGWTYLHRDGSQKFIPNTIPGAYEKGGAKNLTDRTSKTETDIWGMPKTTVETKTPLIPGPLPLSLAGVPAGGAAATQTAAPTPKAASKPSAAQATPTSPAPSATAPPAGTAVPAQAPGRLPVTPQMRAMGMTSHPIDAVIDSKKRVTETGHAYVDVSSFPTSEMAAIGQGIAAGRGIIPLKHDDAEAMRQIENARENLKSMYLQIMDMLPSNPATRPGVAATQKLEKLFQTNPQLSAMSQWSMQALGMLRATEGGSQGMRSSMPMIQTAIDNLPKPSDTVQVALQKFATISQMIDNSEKAILGPRAPLVEAPSTVIPRPANDVLRRPFPINKFLAGLNNNTPVVPVVGTPLIVASH